MFDIAFFKKQETAVIFLGVIFAVIYSSFYAVHHTTFNSPDETANHFFIKTFEETSRLSVPSELSGELGEIIVPRSMRVVNNAIVPGSFVGIIIIYGLIAKLFGAGAIYIIGGVIASLGAWGFYILVREVCGGVIAFFSFIALLVFPAWWYYASLAFFPNVLLVTLFLWAVVFLFWYKKYKKTLFVILSGVALSLAVITRPTEIPWMFAFLVLFLYTYRKDTFILRALPWFFIILAITAAALVSLQENIYGGIFKTGYVFEEGGGSFVFSFFPFGFHPRTALYDFYLYCIKLFWFISVPAILGAAMLVKQYIKERALKSLSIVSAFGLISLWFIIFYGSGTFLDNIADEISLGVSYTRYFLPLYLLSIPLAVFFIEKLFFALILSSRFRKCAAAFLCAVLFLVSFRLTFFDKNDSLALVSETLLINQQKKEAVLASTEGDAIIVTYRQDKLFFPERAVIHTLNDSYILGKLSELSAMRPLYIYTFLSENDLNEKIVFPLRNQGLVINKVSNVYGDALYKVIRDEVSK